MPCFSARALSLHTAIAKTSTDPIRSLPWRERSSLLLGFDESVRSRLDFVGIDNLEVVVIVAVLAIIADAEQCFSTESAMARSTFSAVRRRPFTTKCM